MVSAPLNQGGKVRFVKEPTASDIHAKLLRVAIHPTLAFAKQQGDVLC
jgi:hypothetical protein